MVDQQNAPSSRADHHPMVFSDAVRADFARDGAVCLRGLFADWVEPIRAGIDRNMASPGSFDRSYKPAGSTMFFNDYRNWRNIPEFVELVEHSHLGGCAASLMQSEKAYFFHEHVLVKQPGSVIKTPWHCDSPYYPVQASKSISFWCPVDPIPVERSLQFVAGSHLWGHQYSPQRFDGTPLFPGRPGQPFPDIDAELDQHRILAWAVEPGDAVAFNFGTLHGAAANENPDSVNRRVLSLRLFGEGATLVELPGPSSPPYPELASRDSDAIPEDIFPVIWPLSVPRSRASAAD